jgi:CubicO group peptidase (beta-lactamase class C family)
MLAAASIAAPAIAQEAAGDWAGFLQPAPATHLKLLLHIERGDAGKLSGTIDVPAQAIRGLPLAAITVSDGKLRFSVPGAGATYQGQWDAAAKSWQGQWSQAGSNWPLSFRVPPPLPTLPADWQLPSDTEIAKLIAERNSPRTGQGLVIGVLDSGKTRFVAGGTAAGAKVDRDILFEIGSISKVFTSLILADMVNKGEVSLDDPAAKFLPAGHRMPERGGRQITLRDLATHLSGLPRMADDMDAADGIDNPFEGYDEARLLAFLDRFELARDPGSQWEYSNLGAGLLGYLLGRAAHKDYETLLTERITGPLGMKDTAVALTPAQAPRLAAPFDAYMRPAKPWDIGLLAGAGGIRSTATDMLIFARAVLDPKSPIAPAMKTALSVRIPGQSAEVEQALGWAILHPGPDREVLLHDGGTGGYRSFLAIESAKGRAVVALANSAAEPSNADLALHILLGRASSGTPPIPPPPPPRSKHTEIVLPAAELGKFAGRYDLGSGVVMEIRRIDDGLYALREGIPGAPRLRIFAEGPRAFFWKAVDAQISFTTDDSGTVTGAEFRQGAISMKGSRIKP